MARITDKKVNAARKVIEEAMKDEMRPITFGDLDLMFRMLERFKKDANEKTYKVLMARFL